MSKASRNHHLHMYKKATTLACTDQISPCKGEYNNIKILAC
jgi:hypothetical protein